MSKRMWHEFEPRDMVNTVLPHPDIQGPYTSEGQECPWPWDPPQLLGAPIGQYHCPYCGEMCIAGFDHTDYGPRDENGLNQFDRDYIAWVEEQERREQTDRQ